MPLPARPSRPSTSRWSTSTGEAWPTGSGPRGKLSPRVAAEVLAQAAEGLATAHGAGLVHRDIKPDNLLIESGSGRVKVGDFGLARLATEASDLTREGVVGGTPHYLSPESARGDGEAGPLADLYALGVTLYECLAGEVPFRGSPHRVVRQILQDDPRPPRSLNDAIPRDLETICLKAMAREPHRRYANAHALAEDLRRWLNGEPIHARPTGPVERAWRLARRRPLASTLSAALLGVMLVGSTAVLVLWRKAEASASEARGHLIDSERNYRQARDAVDTLYSKLIASRVLNKPGLDAVRLDVVRAALGYYREFLRHRGDDPALQADMAEANLRAGSLLGEVGDQREALQAIQAATTLFQFLADAQPGDLRLRHKLASARDQAGSMLQQLGKMSEARASRSLACEAYRSLVEAVPEDQRWRRILAHGLGNLAKRRLHGRSQDRRPAELLPGARADRGPAPARSRRPRLSGRPGPDPEQPGDDEPSGRGDRVLPPGPDPAPGPGRREARRRERPAQRSP